jgi:putative methyltransferase (TIGR04325 family)
MNLYTKKILKRIIPRFIIKKLNAFFYYNSFSGGYKSFDELNKISTKYDSNKVVERVQIAFKISRSKSYFNDRDGEVFLKKNIDFKLMNIMSTCMKNKTAKYCVIDYGGSLANFYRTNIQYLRKYNIKWIVVDNEKICHFGNKILKNRNIYFFSNLKKTRNFINIYNLKICLFFFGSSVQYLDKFEDILFEINNSNCKQIIIERQPVLRFKPTTYALQKTIFSNGNFVYPTKLYNYNKLISLVKKYNFFLIESFKGYGNNFRDGEYKTMVFKKR